MKKIAEIKVFKSDDGSISAEFSNTHSEHIYDGNDLQKIINLLENYRSKIGPAVTELVPKKFEKIEDVCNQPTVWIGNSFEGAIIIRMRHPGLGWVSFSFPTETAAQLNDFISYCISTANENTDFIVKQ